MSAVPALAPDTGRAPVAGAAPSPAPGPATVARKAPLYIMAALVLSLAQGLGMNFIATNIPQIAGSFGVTTTEATWLLAAYMAPNASLALILIKMRTQFGLRNFAETGILLFVLVSIVHLFVDDFGSALVLRFCAGAAAAPMSSLAFLYALEPFPPQKKMTIGLATALAIIGMSGPVARIVSPPLLDFGSWHGLYLFEVGLALIAMAAVYVLPLQPQPRAKVISGLDVLSYLLIAVGFGLLAVVLTLGRLYWWLEAPWIGVSLVVALAALTAAVLLELHRAAPLVDFRWIASREVLHFMAVLLTFRVALAEQSAGATAMLQTLGVAPDQVRLLWAAILLSTIVASLACAAIMKPEREDAIHALALLLIGTGAWLDAGATNLTRPEQLIASQMMIAAGGALFLPPALAAGLMSALKKGPNYILSFIIVFLTTQSLGALFGSALLGSFITWREKFHSHLLVEHLAGSDPLVAARLAQLSAAYGRVIADKAVLAAEGVQLLGQQATREAYVRAYDDLFTLIALTCAIALVFPLVRIARRSLAARAGTLSESVRP